MSRLALFCLGAPRIERDGVTVSVRRRRAIALLVYLSVTGRRHSRDTLATLFYPEHDQSQARAGLRRTLSALRQALGEGWLDVGPETVRLKLDVAPNALWSDVAAFQSAGVTMASVVAARLEAVFIVSSTTVGRLSGAFPRLLIVLGYVAGLTLLLIPVPNQYVSWVFPSWVAVVSATMLIGRTRVDEHPGDEAISTPTDR